MTHMIFTVELEFVFRKYSNDQLLLLDITSWEIEMMIGMFTISPVKSVH